MSDLLVVRVLFVLLLGAVSFFLQPFGLSSPLSALLGAASASVVILIEMRLKEVSLKRLIGAALGSTLGIIAAFLISVIIGRVPTSADPRTLLFIQIGRAHV